MRRSEDREAGLVRRRIHGARSGQYGRCTTPGQRLAVMHFFERNPDVTKLFSQRWVEGLIGPVQPRGQVAPLFWALVSPISQRRIIEAFHYLSEEGRSVRRVAGELKGTDEDNVAAILSELEIYRMLRARHPGTRWKPAHRKGLRSADLLVKIRDGLSIFIEVLTIRRSKDHREEQVALEEVRSFLDGLGHRFDVEYELKRLFRCRDVEPCCAFLRRVIDRLGRRNAIRVAHADFMVDGQVGVRFAFRRTSGRGRWVSGMQGVRQSKESGRIKRKLRDKLDKFQLPIDSEACKGFILVLDALVHDAEDVRTAVLGRMGIAVRMGTGGEPEMQVIRQADGNVHDDSRGDLLIREVDFIASMVRPGGMNVSPLDVMVNGDRGRPSHDEACEILWGGPAARDT